MRSTMVDLILVCPMGSSGPPLQSNSPMSLYDGGGRHARRRAGPIPRPLSAKGEPWPNGLSGKKGSSSSSSSSDFL